MTQGKHTPGPWVVIEKSHTTAPLTVGNVDVKDRRRLFAVYLPYGTHGQERSANARLIAAAPDMLEALRALMDLNDNGGPFGGEIYQDRIDRAWSTARAAIARAQGGAA